MADRPDDYDDLHPDLQRELEAAFGAGDDSAGVLTVIEQPTRNPDVLDRLGVIIGQKRDHARDSRFSSGIEAQWMNGEEAYVGIDDVNRAEYESARWAKPTSISAPVTTNAPLAADPTRSTAYVRLTSRYVDAGCAKLAEILLPSNDRAFSFSETPVPDLVKGRGDNRTITGDDGKLLMRTARPGEAPGAQASDPAVAGAGVGAGGSTAPAPAPGGASPGGAGTAGPGGQTLVPLTVADIAEEQIELARKKAKNAEDWVADKLDESHYPSEMRKVIFDGARIGTGILKGPYPYLDKAMALTKDPAGGFTLEIVEKIRPAVCWVDLWNIFPDPTCGENIQKGDFIFERDFMSTRQIEDLKEQPGYITSAIDQVLEEGPALITRDNNAPGTRNDKEMKGRFEIWYMFGTLRREEWEAVRAAMGRNDDLGDLDKVYCIVTLINSTVVKAAFNPLHSGRFPYHAFPWQRRPGHWAGVGVAEQLQTPQRIVNAATRYMLSNAGISGGVQIIIDQSGIKPANKSWKITPNKIWYATGQGLQGSVGNQMQAIEIPNVTPQMLSIIEYGQRLAEETTSIPLVTQGMTGPTTPETLGATQLQNDNANQLLRSIGYTMDDTVTEPLVQQMYEWLLLDPSVPDDCKGDFKIDAHGSVSLVERVIQGQFIDSLMPAVENPTVAKSLGLDPRRFMKWKLKGKHIDPAELMYTPEEMARLDAMPPPPPPQVQVAQLNAQAKTQALTQLAKDNAAQREVDLHGIAAEVNRDGLTAKQEMERTAAVERAAEAKLQMELQIAQLNYAANTNQTLTQVKAELAKESMRLSTQRDLAAADLTADLHKHHHPGPVEAPPVQVPGRAANGQAFSQVGAGA